MGTKPPDINNRQTPSGAVPRVAFVSAGQSPRREMMAEILELSGCDIEVEEFGALDDLDGYELEMMRPGEKDQLIYTRLNDGTPIVIAVGPLEIRIANVCAGLDQKGYDLIIVLSTGLYNEFRTQTPLLHAQQVMDAWLASISMSACNLGVVTPLEKQGGSTWLHLGDLTKFHTMHVMADNNSHIGEAARRLKECDLIFMNSVAYSGEAAERLGTLAGRPVVTARKVLANALNLYLAYLGARPDNHFSNIEARLQAAAPNLTDRERQIIKLAVQGLSNKEAGLKLGISHRTVEKHRSSAMNKLGVSTISGLFRLVMVIK